MLPSLSDPQHAAGIEKMGKEEAWRAFLPAIEGKPYRVIDKTRLRYVLYRAEPDTALLKRVLLLIPRHPEHVDAFFAYLGRFEYRKPIEKLCLVLVGAESVLLRSRRSLARPSPATCGRVAPCPPKTQ